MIHKNITRPEYDALPGINHSKLKYFKDSIKHGSWKATQKFNQTSAMRLGTAVHTLVLEPHKFDDEYICGSGPVNEKTGKTYGTDSQKFQNWLSEQEETGKTYLSTNDKNQAEQVAKNVYKNELAMYWLDQCEYRESAVTWTDKRTGLECKALMDNFSLENLILGDFKTIARSVDYEFLSKTLFTMDYFQQFAFYNDGLRANGYDCKKFIVIFAQTINEQDIATCEIGIDSLVHGSIQYEKCLDNYKDYLSGKVTGYHSDLFTLEIPYWAMSEHLDINDTNLIFEEA